MPAVLDLDDPAKWPASGPREALRVPAGSAVFIVADRPLPPHLHRRHTEFVFIEDGEGTVRMRGADGTTIERRVRPGMLLVIPAGTVHSFAPDEGMSARAVSIFVPPYDPADRVAVPE